MGAIQRPGDDILVRGDSAYLKNEGIYSDPKLIEN
jgi:hypothetical protein